MKALLTLAICVATSACSTRIIDFTLISSKNINISKGAELQRGTVRVKGEDRKRIIVVFPTGEPNAKQAMDKAIESVPGAVALVDGVITKCGWYIPYIYGEAWFEVEGTPLIDPAIKRHIESK